ncbi:Hypothetical Protein CTN_0746 [Thermotoga neapolitana DSM 4359]|uniref:Uncharacterized protein n=1 Tax=Thermotoga neapolitana (strain ATCC 49049 / DSM 4359 / NBRC 107923 / NS-E) TaxID=309803 RepID=B9K7I9_THENN|nr:Hypothetical Protein CTN_0746 [Thermotoga neapolitana DSM 4359]
MFWQAKELFDEKVSIFPYRYKPAAIFQAGKLLFFIFI